MLLAAAERHLPREIARRAPRWSPRPMPSSPRLRRRRAAAHPVAREPRRQADWRARRAPPARRDRPRARGACRFADRRAVADRLAAWFAAARDTQLGPLMRVAALVPHVSPARARPDRPAGRDDGLPAPRRRRRPGRGADPRRPQGARRRRRPHRRRPRLHRRRAAPRADALAARAVGGRGGPRRAACAARRRGWSTIDVAASVPPASTRSPATGRRPGGRRGPRRHGRPARARDARPARRPNPFVPDANWLASSAWAASASPA